MTRRWWSGWVGALVVVSLAAAACTSTSDGSGEFGRDPIPGPETPAQEVSPSAAEVSVPAPDASPPTLDASARVPEVPPAAGASRADGGGLGECAGVEEACGFVSVSLGDGHGCALRAGREVACWGAGGSSVFCSVEAGEAPVCVEDSGGAAVSPVGEFVAVDASVGYPSYSCGVRVVRCF